MIKAGISLFLVVSSSQLAIASSQNIQEFTLSFFGGVDTTTIIYHEKITGDIGPFGEVTFVHTLKLSSRECVVSTESYNTTPPIDSIESSDLIELEQKSGVFELPIRGSFAVPAQDSLFRRRFTDVTGYRNAEHWYANCKVDCIRDPIFSDVNASRLYHNELGLYINYLIETAYYSKGTGLLLIFINQPLPAAGLNTMHGVLIYRISQ